MMEIASNHQRTPRRQRLAAVVAIASLMACTTLVAPALADPQAQLSIPAASYGAVRNVQIELNKSMLVDLPAGVAEVIVSQPNVAAAIMRTRTRAILQGITGGDTNVFFLDDAGRTIQVLDLRVIEEPSQVGNALESALARVIPGSRIKVESVTLGGSVNRVVLTGSVQTAEDRDRAQQVAIQFAGDPENVANIIDVHGAQQVVLQVTVSEIRRDVAKQLGINLSGTVTLGNSTLGFNSAPATANGFSATGGFPMGDVRINAAVQALEQRGALRLLAQPSLTAISGQSAEFLVGGEFPITTSSANGTSIEYKDYGIKLNFTPVLRSNGNVALTIDTGVSEIQAGSFALTRRDVKTSVELPAGSTLAIGGLLDERSSRAIDQVPGLGNIPILGALFRSNDYRSLQTELVILVTPYIVQPTTPANAIPVPTDNVYMANDAEAFFLGAIERRYGVGATGQFRGGLSGSVGFVLE